MGADPLLHLPVLFAPRFCWQKLLRRLAAKRRGRTVVSQRALLLRARRSPALRVHPADDRLPAALDRHVPDRDFLRALPRCLPNAASCRSYTLISLAPA